MFTTSWSTNCKCLEIFLSGTLKNMLGLTLIFQSSIFGGLNFSFWELCSWVHLYPITPTPPSPKFLPWLSPKFTASSLIIMYTYIYMRTCIQNLQSPFSFTNIYVHVYRINRLMLGIQCERLSLEKSNLHLSLSSHWPPVALHPTVGPYIISLSCWHDNWCHHYIDQ